MPLTKPTIDSLVGLQTLPDVASFFGIHPAFLKNILYVRRERKLYISVKIPKKRGGFREISIPPKNIAIMQRRLARELLRLHSPKPGAHGFLRERSIATNARRHQGQSVVLNLDLKDFFHSIHIGRITAILKQPPFSLGYKAAMVVAQICCLADGRVPQGAATSPIISNIVCRQLDDELQTLAKKLGCRYTRYADDLTFSTSRPQMPLELASEDLLTKKVVLGEELISRIEGASFRINRKKVRLYRGEVRQEVTGLTVNEVPNVRRWFIRELDTFIHCYRKFGLKKASEAYFRRKGLPESLASTHPHRMLMIARGKHAFLSMVKGINDPTCRRIQWELYDCNSKVFNAPNAIADIQSWPLNGFSGNFRGWQKLLRHYLNSVLFVRVQRDGGTQGNASAFVVDSNVLVTAGHVVTSGDEFRIGFNDDGLQPKQIIHKNELRGLDYAVLIFEGNPFKDLKKFHFQYRLPEIGEEVVALGYPRIPNRDTELVLHAGTVESLPKGYTGTRFIQTSFQSGGGLSGSPLIDRRGFVIGVMIENVFMDGESREDAEANGRPPIPPRAYGQACPFEYVARARAGLLPPVPDI